MNQNRGMNIMKIVDKVVENLTRGRRISPNSVKSENYFENCNHRIGDMGHIESDNPNLVVHVVHRRIRVIQVK